MVSLSLVLLLSLSSFPGALSSSDCSSSDDSTCQLEVQDATSKVLMQVAKEKMVHLHEAKPKEKAKDDDKKADDKKADDKKADEKKGDGKNKKVDGKKANGENSEMNEAGYSAVLKLKDDKEMKTYVNRVIAAMGLKVEDKAKAKEMMKKKPENFKKLVQAVLKAKESDVLKSEISEDKGSKVDEDGYKYTVQLHDDKKMAKFIEKVAEKKGLAVRDKGGLTGMAPFYSGTKDIQCYKALEEEVDRVAKLKDGSWLKKAGEKEEKKKAKEASDKEDKKSDSKKSDSKKKEEGKKDKKDSKKEEDETEDETEAETEEAVAENDQEIPASEAEGETLDESGSLDGGDLGSMDDTAFA